MAIVRFHHVSKIFYPFIFLIWIGVFNEALGSFLVSRGHFNIINTNIYCLFESIFLLWFFQNIKVFKIPILFPIIIALSCLIWTVEVFFVNPFGSAFSSYFNIFYSFILVLLSITSINKLLIEEKNLLRSPTFLICTGILIYFTYGILVEAFWLYGLGASKNFIAKVYFILSWINPICNLIYSLAILWMRKRQAFTLQF